MHPNTTLGNTKVFGFILKFLLPVSIDIECVFVRIIVTPANRAMSHEQMSIGPLEVGSENTNTLWFFASTKGMDLARWTNKTVESRCYENQTRKGENVAWMWSLRCL